MEGPYTVRMALATCGVNDVDLFQDRTPAQRMASEIFLDEFHVCMDKSLESLKDDLKSYSILTVGEGRIHTIPGVQNKMCVELHH